ncbi:MAG: hypothetical protein M1834_007028 [Cirrosporium novae-zelandiae]|nr:MAG: hypothetical protein M1834_007028 [Cirrosporium novae-zelandiae]
MEEPFSENNYHLLQSSKLSGGPTSSGYPPSPTIGISPLDMHLSSEERAQPELSPTNSSSSPGSSAHDSTSDSLQEQLIPSARSSPSLPGMGDIAMVDEHFPDWPSNGLTNNHILGFGSPTANPFEDGAYALRLDHSLEHNDKVMDSAFDFNRAAASSSPFGLEYLPNGHLSQSDVMGLPLQSGQEIEPIPDPRKVYSPSQSSGLNVQWSRETSHEASPSSNLVTSHQSSPLAFLRDPSPFTSFGDVTSPLGCNSGKRNFHQSNGGVKNSFSSLHQHTVTPSKLEQTPMSPPLTIPTKNKPRRPKLHIERTDNKEKSRVETQIPIKLTLDHLPSGISKLHLPPHTISKPKLLLKPPPPKAADTLELSTMLVCASAMRDSVKADRAYARAAGRIPLTTNGENSPKDSEDQISEAEETKALNGGEVRICSGCITRERKRAARKKQKRAEDEENWQRFEADRVIVFNTQEIKEWSDPAAVQIADSNCQEFTPSHSGPKQVELPMRIACYCRHHSEKEGFQVIFTLKNHMDEFVAQAISNPILITDDHKTHAPMPFLPQPAPALPDGMQLPGAGVFSSTQNFDVSMNGSSGSNQFRISQSTPDLPGLLHNTGQAGQGQFSSPRAFSQVTPAAMTPRNLSRQASPSFNVPAQKRRKGSSSGKVPPSLAMTTLEHAQAPPPTSSASMASMGLSTQNVSPFDQEIQSAMSQIPQNYSSFSTPLQPQYNGTRPSTPNSNDANFFMPSHRPSIDHTRAPLFSAPSSAHPSRPPTPNSNHLNNQPDLQRGRFDQALAAGSFYPVSTSMNHVAAPPVIHKVIPAEGPKIGGIEVTILGSDFFQGLEVVFGDALATTTTFWGPTSLVCLLPPAAQALVVPVSFKHQHPKFATPPFIRPIQSRPVMFTYVSDEQELLRLALAILYEKGPERPGSADQIARQIIENVSARQWGQSSGSSSSNGNHQRRGGGISPSLLEMLDLEGILLKCLDLINVDDDLHNANLDLQGPGRHTLLHYAASLGFQRLSISLLEKGANPNLRDANGFTAMYFALLNRHLHIAYRLHLAGADFTLRGLRRLSRPQNIPPSAETGNHVRSRSVGSSFSHSTSRPSIAYLRSNWDPSESVRLPSSQSTSTVDNSSSLGDDDDLGTGLWIPSRRNSLAPMAHPSDNKPSGTSSPTAAAQAIMAWGDQITAQIQHFQQTVQRTLPNWEIPKFPPLPTFPDNNPVVQRISSLVPHRTPSPTPSHSPRESDKPKDSDSKWWEIFTTFSSPPAYHEIFPSKEQLAGDLKKVSATQAASEAVIDSYYEGKMHSGAEASSSSLAKAALGRNDLSESEQEQLRIAHAQKMKGVWNDRKLFFIWIPILLLILWTWFPNGLWGSVSAGYIRLRKTYESYNEMGVATK